MIKKCNESKNKFKKNYHLHCTNFNILFFSILVLMLIYFFSILNYPSKDKRKKQKHNRCIKFDNIEQNII
jgi:hypothetical protein